MADRNGSAGDVLERQIPHNVEAERAVLGSILLLPEVFDEVSLVIRDGLIERPDEIQSPSCRTTQSAQFLRCAEEHQLSLGKQSIGVPERVVGVDIDPGAHDFGSRTRPELSRSARKPSFRSTFRVASPLAKLTGAFGAKPFANR